MTRLVPVCLDVQESTVSILARGDYETHVRRPVDIQALGRALRAVGDYLKDVPLFFPRRSCLRSMELVVCLSVELAVSPSLRLLSTIPAVLNVH